MRDTTDVCRTCDSGVDVAVVFPRLLASIQLLVTAVDTFLKSEAAAVRQSNLMHCLPKNADQARFVFW